MQDFGPVMSSRPPGPIHGLHGQEWNRSNPSLAVQASDRLLVDAPVFGSCSAESILIALGAQ